MSTPKRKGLAVAVATALVTTGLSILPLSAASAAPGDEVVFNDPNLEACVIGALTTANPTFTVPVTEADAQSLDDLSCFGLGIVDLTGLEAFTNLETLRLADNDITDVNPLGGLTQLQTLYLFVNQITDISPLAGLDSIENLALAQNQITDISSLAGLDTLINLNLEYNQVTDVTALAGLGSLEILGLDVNQITDISPLAGLISLTYLTLSENQVLDLSTLEALAPSVLQDATYQAPPDVKAYLGVPLTLPAIFDRDGSQVTPTITSPAGGSYSGGPLSPVTFEANGDYTVTWSETVFSGSFTVTVASAVDIPDPNLLACINSTLGGGRAADDPLTELEAAGVTSLDCQSMGIASLTGLEAFTNLTVLMLDFNDITDVSPLAGLTALSDLYLSANQIADISPLAGLDSIAILNLPQNQIDDISSLAGLDTLTRLGLEWNQITDVSALAGLGSLDILGLDYNQISDISPLAGLVSVTYLTLDENLLLDLSALKDLAPSVLRSARYQTPPDVTALVGVPLTLPEIIDRDGNQVTPTITSPAGGSYSGGPLSPVTFEANGDYTVTWSETAFSGSFIVTVASVADIPDAALFACVDLALPGVPGGRTVITNVEAESLASLDCSSIGISDLTGLEAFANLTDLKLADNQVADLGPLAGLTGLTVLDLSGNLIADASPLAALTGLAELYLDNNQITDLSPFGGMPGSIATANDQAPAGMTAQVGKPVSLYTITNHDGTEITGSITPGTFTVTSKPAAAGALATTVAMPGVVAAAPTGTVVFTVPGVYTFTWSQAIGAGGPAVFSGQHQIVVTAGPPPPPVPNPPPGPAGQGAGTGALPWTGTDSRPVVALALALVATGLVLRLSRRTRYQPLHRTG